MAYLLAGRTDEARSLAVRPSTLTRRLGSPGRARPTPLRLAADVASTGGAEAAEATTATPWPSPPSSACAPSSPTATSASASSTAEPATRRRQEHLTTAATMYREMGMSFWLEKAEAALKEVVE